MKTPGRVSADRLPIDFVQFDEKDANVVSVQIGAAGV